MSRPRAVYVMLVWSLWPWNARGGPRTRMHQWAHERHWRRRFAGYDVKLANSRFTADWTRAYWGAACDVLHPPVNVTVPDGPKRDVIAALGRFTPFKRQLDLVRAFRDRVSPRLPGWELVCVGTVGQIEQAVPLDDGRYNILVRGEVRFRVVGEVSREPYRTARVIVQPEESHNESRRYEQKSWLADLSRQYLHYLPDQIAVPEIDTVELEALTNVPVEILVGESDHAYLTDFGLIRRREGDTGLTKTGQFMGSADYAAPEQIEGKPVDGRAHVYSLGCVL